MPSSKPRGKARPVVGRPRRRRRKGVLTGLWGATSAMLGVAFLLVEGTFLLVSLILSLVVTGLTAASEFLPSNDLGTDRPQREAKPAKPRGLKGKRPSGPVIRCTATGKPIDRCPCSARHVRTADGVRRYGGKIGSPIMGGRRAPARGKTTPGKKASSPSSSSGSILDTSWISMNDTSSSSSADCSPTSPDCSSN